MKLISTVQAPAPIAKVSPPDQPSTATWVLAIFFIPFSAWVLWTSWQWRRERHHHLH